MGLNPCVRGECVNAICEIGDFFSFLPLCLWRIVDYQRFAKTENGSDLIKNGAPFFVISRPRSQLPDFFIVVVRG